MCETAGHRCGPEFQRDRPELNATLYSDDEIVRDRAPIGRGKIVIVVSGLGKRDHTRFDLKLDLPQVIVGEDDRIYAPKRGRHDWVPLETDFGACALDVGFDVHVKS